MAAFDKNHIFSQQEYDSNGTWIPNNGKDLKWCREDNSTEIMLSLNFFRHIVPQFYQSTDDMMRQWLINHDIIAGFKKEIPIPPNIGQFLTDELNPKLVDWEVVEEPFEDDSTKKRKVLKLWIKKHREKGTFDIVAERDSKDNTKYTGDYNIYFNANEESEDENFEPYTDKERETLISQLSKVIPYGAVISTKGSISETELQELYKLARWTGADRSVYSREGLLKKDRSVKRKLFLKGGGINWEYFE